MPRRARFEEEESEDVNLTPMLDVVFILLIFFIVTAQFVKEPGVQIERPEAQSATDTRPAILVAITGDNEVYINREEVDIREVRVLVQELREDNPLGEAVLQVDTNSENGTLVEVLNAIQAAGAPVVYVATEQD